jgi:hypothetical protein
MSEEPRGSFSAGGEGMGGQPPSGQQAQPLRDFVVDASNMSTHYANFARVTGTPEELILDFGLNTQMVPNPTEPVKLTHRLVLNFYTAKRLLLALNAAIQQHERVYGVLEIDVQKRIKGPLMPPGMPPSPSPAAGRPGT